MRHGPLEVTGITMRASSAEADILRYAAGLADDQPSRFLAIGGLPRCGTSSCERRLHGFRGVFVADEFQGFNSAAYLAGLRYKTDYIRSELDLWTDADGRTWRGTTRGGLERRLALSELVNLLLATRPSKFAGKKAGELRVFGFKLPLIECRFERVWPVFGDAPFPFVYCARDPAAMVSSLWTMPWVAEVDDERFVRATLQLVGQSIAGFERIVATGARTAIWRTPSSATDEETVLARLGLLDLAGARETAPAPVDEWPKRRRRAIGDLSATALQVFERSPEVARYRALFDV